MPVAHTHSSRPFIVVTEAVWFRMRETEIRPWVAVSVLRRWAIGAVSVLINVALAARAAPPSLSLVRVADIPLGGDTTASTTRVSIEAAQPLHGRPGHRSAPCARARAPSH